MSSKKAMQAKTTFSLKDELFNAETVGRLSAWLAGAYPGFDETGFQSDVLGAFGELELKQRITHISETMAKYLPTDYRTACEIVVAALPEALDPRRSDDDFGEFIIAPLSSFVAIYGATEEHLEQSLAALTETTKRFSAEFAIRTFIKTFPIVRSTSWLPAHKTTTITSADSPVKELVRACRGLERSRFHTPTRFRYLTPCIRTRLALSPVR